MKGKNSSVKSINKVERLRKKKSERNFYLVLTALFSALVIVMTVIPYTGYINYSGVFEITTLHIVVILGATVLGARYGALLGGVWGVTCMLRALTNPLWIDFVNPLVSVLPRILVGLVAGALFSLLCKKRLNSIIALIISTIAASLTNTLLVLAAYSAFAGTLNNMKAIYELLKTVILTVIGINGIIEIVAAVLLVPVLYKVISHEILRRNRYTETIK